MLFDALKDVDAWLKVLVGIGGSLAVLYAWVIKPIQKMLKINKEQSAIKLKLSIDTHYGEIGEYFEIFMERMLLCKKAANFLGMDFHLIINEQTLL